MLIDKKIFFAEYRSGLDKDRKLTQKEVRDIDLFLDMMQKHGNWFSIPQWAYILATVFHETAHTMAPVREAFKMSEDWRRRNLWYFPHYGRGYVQITHEDNYKRMALLIKQYFGITIVQRDDFLKPDISFFSLIIGFKNGTFTGKAIYDYIPANVSLNLTRPEPVEAERNAAEILFRMFKSARRCINGTDKDDLIAGYALDFLRILNLSIIQK